MRIWFAFDEEAKSTVTGHIGRYNPNHPSKNL